MRLDDYQGKLALGFRPAGTKVAQDAQGRDLNDLGDGKGKVCKNLRPIAIPLIKEAVNPPPPVETPAPPPPPPAPPEVVMPPEPSPLELITLAPLPTPPQAEKLVVTLVWDDNKSWIWKYTPLWCIDVRSWKDVYKPTVCAAIALGGFWAAGGFKAAALYKLAPSPMNPIIGPLP